jgi:dCTP deaminase
MREPDPDARLVVSPILDASKQLAENQAAIDVRLGRAFSVVRAWSQGVAEDLSGVDDQTVLEPQIESFVLQFGEPLIMHPHQFALARTLEIVRLPKNLLAYVIGRSSWGRRGLIVATAVVVHPGFSGAITLELKNVGEVPIALYPMDRIAQLTFHDITRSGVDTSVLSQFSRTFVPTLGSVRDVETYARLRVLAERRRKD